MRRRIWCFLVIVVLPGTGCGLWSLDPYRPATELPDVPFRTRADHDSVMADREWPYLIEVEAEGRGALAYFGSRHTRDPDDPQIQHIVDLASRFSPTVVAVENRGGFYRGGLGGAVRALGEFGAAIEFARTEGIPVYTLEPEWEDEVAYVLREYTPAEATLFYTLRVFLGERGDRSAEELNRLARHLLRKRGSRPGLRGAIGDLDGMDAVWRESFADGGDDWRTLPPRALSPDEAGTRIQRLAARVNRARDHHATSVLLELVRSGERVFAVAGGSHVVVQEPVLRALFDG